MVDVGSRDDNAHAGRDACSLHFTDGVRTPSNEPLPFLVTRKRSWRSRGPSMLMLTENLSCFKKANHCSSSKVPFVWIELLYVTPLLLGPQRTALLLRSGLLHSGRRNRPRNHARSRCSSQTAGAPEQVLSVPVASWIHAGHNPRELDIRCPADLLWSTPLPFFRPHGQSEPSTSLHSWKCATQSGHLP